MASNYSIAIYLRISNEDKNKCEKAESNSIESQRHIIQNFITKKDEFKNFKVVEYVDDGFSGTDFKRPSIQTLFEDIKENKINCIIVKDLSRFGRNYIEVVNYLENILPFFNVRFISINDNFDSKNSKYNLNDIDINFKSIIYDYYSKDLSSKIMSSKINKAKQGNYLAYTAPFGYKKSKEQKGKLEIDEETSLIVKNIFNLFLDGNSCLEIAKKLNENNVKTRLDFINKTINAKNLWKREHIREILSNKVYIGTIEYLRTSRNIKTRHKQVTNSKNDWIVVEDCHTGIINKQDFYKVQDMLTTRKTTKIRERKNIFAYKLYCGYCDYSLYNSSKTYFCRTRNYEYNDNCKHNVIEKEVLENVVLKGIQKIAFDILNKNNNNTKNELKILEKELIQLEDEKDALYMLYLNENMDKEQYLSSRKDIETKKENITKKIESLKNETRRYIKLDGIEKVIYEDKLTYEMVDLFVKKIYIYNKSKIKIEWNFQLDFSLF